MAGIWQTLIGAAAAIAGGLLAVWWQASHADDVARRIRRGERREEGLFALNAKLTEIHATLDPAFRQVEGQPSLSPWGAVASAAAELRSMWETELSGKIPDQAITKLYIAFDQAARACVPWDVPPPPRKGTDPDEEAREFVREFGTTLANLGDPGG